MLNFQTALIILSFLFSCHSMPISDDGDYEVYETQGYENNDDSKDGDSYYHTTPYETLDNYPSYNSQLSDESESSESDTGIFEMYLSNLPKPIFAKLNKTAKKLDNIISNDLTPVIAELVDEIEQETQKKGSLPKFGKHFDSFASKLRTRVLPSLKNTLESMMNTMTLDMMKLEYSARRALDTDD